MATKQNFDSLLTNLRAISTKQKMTIMVLGLTILILWTFFLSGCKHPICLTGISLVTGGVIFKIRVAALHSMRVYTMNCLDVSTHFKEQRIRWYGNRKKIFFNVTPFCIAVSC